MKNILIIVAVLVGGLMLLKFLSKPTTSAPARPVTAGAADYYQRATGV